MASLARHLPAHGIACVTIQPKLKEPPGPAMIPILTGLPVFADEKPDIWLHWTREPPADDRPTLFMMHDAPNTYTVNRVASVMRKKPDTVLVAPSHYAARSFGEHPHRVVYHAADPDEIPQPNELRHLDNCVGYIGRTTPEKGTHRLLSLQDSLIYCTQGDDGFLKMFGGKRMAKKDVLASATVIVIPSDGTYETGSLVAMEAWASGCRVAMLPGPLAAEYSERAVGPLACDPDIGRAVKAAMALADSHRPRDWYLADRMASEYATIIKNMVKT